MLQIYGYKISAQPCELIDFSGGKSTLAYLFETNFMVTENVKNLLKVILSMAGVSLIRFINEGKEDAENNQEDEEQVIEDQRKQLQLNMAGYTHGIVNPGAQPWYCLWLVNNPSFWMLLLCNKFKG